MPRSEYWKSSPFEIGLFFESKRSKFVNGIHEDALYNLHKRRDELKAKGVKVA